MSVTCPFGSVSGHCRPTPPILSLTVICRLSFNRQLIPQHYVVPTSAIMWHDTSFYVTYLQQNGNSNSQLYLCTKGKWHSPSIAQGGSTIPTQSYSTSIHNSIYQLTTCSAYTKSHPILYLHKASVPPRLFVCPSHFLAKSFECASTWYPWILRATKVFSPCPNRPKMIFRFQLGR